MLIHVVYQKFLTLPPHPSPPLIIIITTTITIGNTTSTTITIIISFIQLIYLRDSLTSPL